MTRSTSDRLSVWGWMVLLLFAAPGCSSSADELPAEILPEGYTEAGTIDLEEVVRIGEDTGTLFGGVGGVVANQEGDIFVADHENTHIRVFSPEGDSLDTFGRKGQGPGEFEALYRLYMTENDSIIVDDRRSRQLSIFEPEPPFSFVRVFPVPRPGGAFPTQIMTSDTTGYFVVYYHPFAGDQDGPITPDRRLAWLGDTGEVIQDSLLTVVGQPGILGSSGNMRLFVSVPFGKGPEFAAGPTGTIFYGRTDSLRISQYDTDGTLVRTVRLPYEPIPVTDDDVDSVMTARNEQVRDLLRQVDFPGYRPAFRELIGDDQGRVWIDVIDRPFADMTTWVIVDVTTREIIETELPKSLSIRYIREGKVYGVHTDEYGLGEVVVYEIRDSPV